MTGDKVTSGNRWLVVGAVWTVEAVDVGLWRMSGVLMFGLASGGVMSGLGAGVWWVGCANLENFSTCCSNSSTFCCVLVSFDSRS